MVSNSQTGAALIAGGTLAGAGFSSAVGSIGLAGGGFGAVGTIRFGLKLSRINYRESKSLIFDTSSFM